MKRFGLLLAFIPGFGLSGCSETGLHVYSNPIRAEFVMADSGLVGMTDDRLLLPNSLFRSGKTQRETIVLMKEGYRTKEVPVVLERGKENFTVPEVIDLEPLSTTLTVLSTPEGARVSFNVPEEELPDKWPQTFVANRAVVLKATRREAEALAGKLKFAELVLTGYRPVDYRSGGEVPLRPGENYELNIPFASSTTTLHVITDPESGASVSIGGRYLGETPVTRDFALSELPSWGIATKSHVELAVEVRREGFRTLIDTASIPVGERSALRYQLVPTGQYRFMSDPAGASVTIVRESGERKPLIGRTPFVTPIDPPLKPGDRVLWEAIGYKDDDTPVVRDDQWDYYTALEEKVTRPR